MKLSEKIQEALREQQEINLSDPAVQKRLAAQWGYVPAGAQPAPSVPDDMIEQAVTRFLSWKLPKDFHPDDGVVFIPTKGRGYDSPYWPYGTNLLNAQQARDMLRYVLAVAPEAKP